MEVVLLMERSALRLNEVRGFEIMQHVDGGACVMMEERVGTTNELNALSRCHAAANARDRRSVHTQYTLTALPHVMSKHSSRALLFERGLHDDLWSQCII